MPLELKNYDPAIAAGANVGVALDLTDITDNNGNEILEIDGVTSAVNYFRASNSATGNRVELSAQGDDSNVGITISPKGTGSLVLGTAGATTTNVIDVSASGVNSGKGVDVSDLDALTTGFGLHLASSATAVTGAGRILLSNHTGATSTSGVLNEIASSANDETVVLRVTSNDLLAGGKLVDLVAGTATTATILNLDGLDSLTTGGAIVVDSNSSSSSARILVKIVNDNTAATGTTTLQIQQDAAAVAIKVTGVIGAPTTGVDLSTVGSTNYAFQLPATATTTLVQPLAIGTSAASGAVRINVDGTARYIFFYT